MNDVDVLEEMVEEYNASYPDEKEWIAIYPNQMQAIENLIQRNKDLEQIEQEHKEENGMLRERLEKIEEYIKQCDWHDNDVYIGEDILDLLEEDD